MVLDLVPLVLLASWPFVAFLANNKEQVLRVEQVLIPWGLYLGLVIATTSVLALLVPNRPVARIAVVIGALSVVFFSFGSLADILILAGIQRGTVWLAVWLAIFVATGWLGWLLSRRTSAQLVTTVVALALLSWPTVELAAARLTGAGNRATEPASGSVTAPPHASRTKPNVYWFLLDGYARDDSLKHYFDHDNGPFLRYLAERGFRVAEASYSNYDNTTFSLTTTLNTGYRYLPGASRPDSAAQVSALSGYNPVVRKFVSLGYRYIHAPYAGAAKTQCGGSEDRCIRARPSGRIPLNEIQVNLLQLTPLFRVLRQALQGAFRYDHIFVEDVMAALGKSEPSPFFLFAHILSPHAPPRYTENCERLDGVTATIDVGEGVYSPTQFRTDTVCTNRSVERAVAEIAKRDSSDPIIILQGDHGFKFRLPGEPVPDPDTVTRGAEPVRRLAILNAFRLPETCRDSIYDTISPINTFRLVFACIEGRTPDFLPDRHFVRPHGSAGSLVEVHPQSGD